MALLNGIPKTNANIMKQLLRTSIQFLHKDVIQKSEVDLIDEFTTDLMKKKFNKWRASRITRRKIDNKHLPKVLDSNCVKDDVYIDIKKYSRKELDDLITELLDEHNLQKVALLMKQCIDDKIYPSIDILLRFVTCSARNGHYNSVRTSQELLKKIDTHEYQKRGELKNYLAEVTWVRGNISESLKLFEEAYRHEILRRNVTSTVKYLISNLITEGSEAMLVTVTQFAENLAVNYNDCSVLFCVWQLCFLSEWYADQCRAQDILDRHPTIINAVARRIFYISNLAVKSHRPEAIHSLLEVLLKYNTEVDYGSILSTLFEYRCSQNDIRSCAEILQWASQNKIALHDSIEEKFILLLTRDRSVKPKSTPAKDFQLKF